MAIKNSNIEKTVEDLRVTVGRIAAANNALAEEVATLKQGYGQLVENVNSRLKVLHEKLFRPGGPQSGAEKL